MPSINRSSIWRKPTIATLVRAILNLLEMLSEIGLSSMDALVEKTVPAAIFDGSPIDLPESRMEADVLAELLQLARANKPMKSLIGMGYYDCITRLSFCGMSSRIPVGTRPIPLTNRDFARSPGGAFELPNNGGGSHGDGDYASLLDRDDVPGAS